MNIFFRVIGIVGVSTQLLGMYEKVILPKCALKLVKEYTAKAWESFNKRNVKNVGEKTCRKEKYWIGVSTVGNGSTVRKAVLPFYNVNSYNICVHLETCRYKLSCFDELEYRKKDGYFRLVAPEYQVFDHFWDNFPCQAQCSFSWEASFFVVYLAAEKSKLMLKKSLLYLCATKPLRIIQKLDEFDPSFDEEFCRVFINDEATKVYVVCKERVIQYFPISDIFREFVDSVSDVKIKFLKN